MVIHGGSVQVVDKRSLLDKRAGALFYFIPFEEKFIPAVEVPKYALVVISLKRNVGSLVYISKHQISHDNEWVVPLVINGQRMEFVPKYLSDVYTLDRQSQLRPSISDQCISVDKDLSTEQTIKLISDFDSTMVDGLIAELSS